MAETAPVPAAPAAKAPRKKSSSRKKNPGSSVSDLILNIVTRSRDRKGVSVAALKKELVAGGYDVEKNKARIKIALKSLVDRQLIVQVKGIGASGSFKLNKTGTVKAPKKPGAKTKKSAAKRSAVTPAKAKKSPGQKPGVKKASRKVKRPPSAAAKKSGKSPKRAANKQRAGKKVNKSSPIKKRKPVRPKATKSKVNKKTSAKKK